MRGHNGSWIVPSNWDTSTVPTDADDVLIGGTDGVPRTITYDYSGPDVSLNSLTLDLNGSTSSATNTLFMPSAYNLSTYAETVGYTGNGTINNAAVSNSVNTLTLGNYFGSSAMCSEIRLRYLRKTNTSAMAARARLPKMVALTLPS